MGKRFAGPHIESAPTSRVVGGVSQGEVLWRLSERASPAGYPLRMRGTLACMVRTGWLRHAYQCAASYIGIGVDG